MEENKEQNLFAKIIQETKTNIGLKKWKFDFNPQE